MINGVNELIVSSSNSESQVIWKHDIVNKKELTEVEKKLNSRLSLTALNVFFQLQLAQ